MSAPLSPGATIGIIGGGQLGRMLAMAAARLGYRTVVLEPQEDAPASQVTNGQIVAAYDDPAALAELAERGITASAVIPAPSLLPVSESGFVRGALHDETVLRSAETGLAEDGIVSPLVVGDAPVRTLDSLELEQAIVASVASPPLDRFS